MTTIEIDNPMVEAALQTAASAAGMPLQAYALQALREAMRTGDVLADAPERKRRRDRIHQALETLTKMNADVPGQPASSERRERLYE